MASHVAHDIVGAARVFEVDDPVARAVVAEVQEAPRVLNLGEEKGHQGERAHPLGGGGDVHGLTGDLERAPERVALDLELAQVDVVDRGAQGRVEVLREPRCRVHGTTGSSPGS